LARFYHEEKLWDWVVVERLAPYKVAADVLLGTTRKSIIGSERAKVCLHLCEARCFSGMFF